MTSRRLNQALDGIDDHRDARIERRCFDCEPRLGVAKIPAVSVSDANRCDRCGHLILDGQSFWAVFLPVD